jgi:hypothetical protein
MGGENGPPERAVVWACSFQFMVIGLILLLEG